MTQTEGVEAYGRFRTARAMARIETDSSYDPSPGTFTEMSGAATVAEMEPKSAKANFSWSWGREQGNADFVSASHEAKVIFLWLWGREQVDAVLVSASHEIVIDRIGDGPSRTSDSLFAQYDISAKAGVPATDAEIGKAAKLTDELHAVVYYARVHGLQEIADRLVELGQQPFSDDDAALQAESAKCFVEYCVARHKRTRPLMTVTPEGELDSTWINPEDERIVMRFFPNKLVWVAYKLAMEKGSFEISARDLIDPNLHFKFPFWS